jgi:hypothetical protein
MWGAMKIGDIPPQDLRAARKNYEEHRHSIAALATSLGVSARSLSAFIRKEGWTAGGAKKAKTKPRSPAKKSKTSTLPERQETQAHSDLSAKGSAAPAATETEPSSLSQRLDKVVRKELVTAETRLRRGPVAAAERNARVLTALVKAMAELARLERQEKGAERNDGEAGGATALDHHDTPPTDVAELQAELARRLEILRRSRNSGTV